MLLFLFCLFKLITNYSSTVFYLGCVFLMAGSFFFDRDSIKDKTSSWHKENFHSNVL